MLQIKFNFKGFEMLAKLSEKVRKAIKVGLERAVIFASMRAKKRFGSHTTPTTVKNVTGAFRRSIRPMKVVPIPGGFEAGIESVGVKYAVTHEYGATIKAKIGGYLNFKVGQQWVRVKEVVIPKRPMVRPGISENIQQMLEIVRQEIIKEVG